MSAEENPYAPPKVSDVVVGVKSGRVEDLKAVAIAQKIVIVCILLNIVTIMHGFSWPPTCSSWSWQVRSLWLSFKASP